MKPFLEVFSCDSITLDLTNSCNLSCSYCFEHNKNADHMSIATAIKAVELAYKSRPNREHPLGVNFFGGEPLLNWRVMRGVIDHCNIQRYKVQYGITTNLTILTDEMIQYFDDNSIPILVSIDGIKKVHDANRCNSYDTVRGNIDKLVNQGLGLYLEARMTIMPKDIRYAIDGVKEIFDMGISNICPIPVYDTHWRPDQLQIAKSFYKELAEFFIEVLKERKRNISIKYIDDSVMDLVFKHDTENDIRCPIFKNTWCTIAPNGDVYACHQGPTMVNKYRDLFKLGNLDSINETKIYTNNEMCKSEYILKECDSCIAKGLCKSGCPTENLRVNDDSSKPSDSYCALQRIIWSNAKYFKDKFLALDNVRNRRLNIIKENIKLMDYMDEIFSNTDLNDELSLTVKLLHLQEMYDNIKDIVNDRVKEDINDKMAIVLSYLAAKKNKSLEVVIDEKEDK